MFCLFLFQVSPTARLPRKNFISHCKLGQLDLMNRIGWPDLNPYSGLVDRFMANYNIEIAIKCQNHSITSIAYHFDILIENSPKIHRTWKKTEQCDGISMANFILSGVLNKEDMPEIICRHHITLPCFSLLAISLAKHFTGSRLSCSNI